MEIFFSDIRDVNHEKTLCPGRGSSRGSALAYSLLLLIMRDKYGISELPAISADEGGKPFFCSCPELHFSLSHTDSHVMAAVSDMPIGVDVEAIKPRSEKVIRKLATDEELACFSFHELWALRESYFKLFGSGELRRLRFYRKDGEIVPPTPDVKSVLYGDISGCAAAASCFLGGSLPVHLTEVPASVLVRL